MMRALTKGPSLCAEFWKGKAILTLSPISGLVGSFLNARDGVADKATATQTTAPVRSRLLHPSCLSVTLIICGMPGLLL